MLSSRHQIFWGLVWLIKAVNQWSSLIEKARQTGINEWIMELWHSVTRLVKRPLSLGSNQKVLDDGLLQAQNKPYSSKAFKRVFWHHSALNSSFKSSLCFLLRASYFLTQCSTHSFFMDQEKLLHPAHVVQDPKLCPVLEKSKW